MRAALRSLLLIGLALGTVGCLGVRGSGNVVTRYDDIEVPFSSIEVSSSFDVTISIGESVSLELRFDDNLEKYLDVGVKGDTLLIGLKPGTGVFSGTLRAEVTVPSFTRIKSSGASKIHLRDQLSVESFQLDLSGASNLDGSVQSKSMTANLSGASQLTISGSATSLVVEASGASDVKLGDLAVEDLVIELSGASSGEVSVSGTISAAVSGASSLVYHGSPTFTRQEVSGASEITKGS